MMVAVPSTTSWMPIRFRSAPSAFSPSRPVALLCSSNAFDALPTLVRTCDVDAGAYLVEGLLQLVRVAGEGQGYLVLAGHLLDLHPGLRVATSSSALRQDLLELAGVALLVVGGVQVAALLV
jgi:hypothetical protein